MTSIYIDNRQVEVGPGDTVLDAAQKLGIDIPTLCFLKDMLPQTSCMVCLVKIEGAERFVPACATPATDGLRVRSDTGEVRHMRKAALEMLLSEHLGDCDATCQCACPSRMDIPLMTRQVRSGRLEEAIATIKKDIALPAVTGRICRAPCEAVCRRGAKDGAVAICTLHRFVADWDLARPSPYLPPCKPAGGKKVAIVGAGPAGLAAAYHLLQLGHACTILDNRPFPGGMLRYGIAESRLPRSVLDAEIEVVRRMGACFRSGVTVAVAPGIDDLRREFDAVVVCVGRIHRPQDTLGLPATAEGVDADVKTRRTALAGVFVCGDARRHHGLAIRAIADGKAAAFSVDNYLGNGQPPSPPAGAGKGDESHLGHPPFSVHVGSLHGGEIDRYMPGAFEGPRHEAGAGGLSEAAASDESARCLHCDCRKPDCKLRRLSQQYGARAGHYKGLRRPFEQDASHAEVIYESGKCISCGLCIEIARRRGFKAGLTFLGRGFNVRVAPPFGRPLAEALAEAAVECAQACPTGALALRETQGKPVVA